MSAGGPGGFLDADASAQIEEVVFLVPQAGAPSTPVPFSVLLDLAGALDVGGLGIPASGNLQLVSARVSASLALSGFAVTGVGPASFAASRVAQVAAGAVQADDTTVQLQQNTAGTVADGLFDVRLTASATVTPNSAFTIRAVVGAESAADAGFDSATRPAGGARLGVVVPEGYALVSSSGLFLTAPEPEAATAGALAALGALGARRSRRATAQARAVSSSPSGGGPRR